MLIKNYKYSIKCNTSKKNLVFLRPRPEKLAYSLGMMGDPIEPLTLNTIVL